MKLKSHSEIAENLTLIFGQLLKRKVLTGSEIIRKDEPLWDSLMNLELILSLEDSFGIQLLPEEIECMDSSFKIQHILFKKLNGDM